MGAWLDCICIARTALDLSRRSENPLLSMHELGPSIFLQWFVYCFDPCYEFITSFSIFFGFRAFVHKFLLCACKMLLKS